MEANGLEDFYAAVTMQWWMLDAGGTKGVAASSGVPVVGG